MNEWMNGEIIFTSYTIRELYYHLKQSHWNWASARDTNAKCHEGLVNAGWILSLLPPVWPSCSNVRAWLTPPSLSRQLMRRQDIKPQKEKNQCKLCTRQRLSKHFWLADEHSNTINAFKATGPSVRPSGIHHELVKVAMVLLCSWQRRRTETFLKTGKRPTSCLVAWRMKEMTLKSIKLAAIPWKGVQ